MNDTTVLEQLLDRLVAVHSLSPVVQQVLDHQARGETLTSLTELDSPFSDARPELLKKLNEAKELDPFNGWRDSNNAEPLGWGNALTASLSLWLELPGSLISPEDSVVADVLCATATRAAASSACAQLLGLPQGDVVLSAALLCDVGVLALYRELEDDYLTFLVEAKSKGHDLSEMETASLGFDHRTLAAKLLERWNLPEEVSRVVGSSKLVAFQSSVSAEYQTLATLHLGDLAVELTEAEAASEEPVSAIIAHAEKWFAWTPDQVQQWCQSWLSCRNQLGQWMGIPKRNIASLMELVDRCCRARQEEKDQNAPATSGQPAAMESLDELDRAVEEWAEDERPSNNDFWAAIDQHHDGEPVGFEKWDEDPGLLGRVTRALQQCRMQRQPMSLILAQVDDYQNIVFMESVDGVYRIQQSILMAFNRLSQDERGEALEVTDDRFALLLPGLERHEGTRLGNSILQLIRQWSQARCEKNGCPISLSLGCASVPVPAKNFDPRVLIQGAQRCLEAVQLGTGNGLKSIDVFY